MASGTSDLIVRLSLDTTQFEGSLSKFEGQMTKLQASCTNAATGITNFKQVTAQLQTSAQTLTDKLAAYKDQDIEKVVFDATNLIILSSSGIRTIMYCKQKLGASPEIVFVNCKKMVLDVLDLVGLRPFITFKER